MNELVTAVRVCLISREYPPDTGFGGIATFTRHLAHGLNEIGHEVEVVALAKDGNDPDLQNDDGIPVHRVVPLPIGSNLGWSSLCMPYSRYVMRTNSALFAKFQALHQERPFDAIDSPELLAEGFYPAVTKCAPMLVRLYTPHSKFIAERLHNVTDTFDHQFVAMVERIAMLQSDLITSPSLDLAQYVAADLGIPVQEIDIVYNPIDAIKFSPGGPRAHFGRPGPTILFVGRLEARKGIHYLIDAVPKIVEFVPDAHIVVIGDDTQNASGQKSVLTEIKEKLTMNGCSQSVTFINRVPLDSLPDYYRGADVCVVPSLYDNSPYTCLEAMSCGRAVIGTDGGGTKEYLEHGQSGIIVPAKNAESIADAIIRLLKDEPERQRLAQNARRRVLEVFDRKVIARQTAALYETAAARFVRNREGRLYKDSSENILLPADEILYQFDRMIGNLVLQASLRARLKAFFELTFKRPRLTIAKIAVGLFNVFGFGQLDLAKQLKKEVAEKERSRLMFGPAEIGL
ncbi:MAG: glycosyltransferase family 4 protein [Candidatus Melainabacteria bacterium]|nr:glycosyltransferase family 4 protein [Candidatus Melainabacteria bacterium]